MFGCFDNSNYFFFYFLLAGFQNSLIAHAYRAFPYANNVELLEPSLCFCVRVFKYCFFFFFKFLILSSCYLLNIFVFVYKIQMLVQEATAQKSIICGIELRELSRRKRSKCPRVSCRSDPSASYVLIDFATEVVIYSYVREIYDQNT